MMKNIVLMWMLTFGFVGHASVVNAQQFDPASISGRLQVLDAVNHNKHFLVINDRIYYMRINFKVYIYEGANKPRRKVNRYALKSGQSVIIQNSGTHEKEYIDALLIHNDSQ